MEQSFGLNGRKEIPPAGIGSLQPLLNLFVYCWHLFLEILFPALFVVTAIVGISWARLNSSIKVDPSTLASVDHLIVQEQIRRLGLAPAQVALIGDSSCLMGIHPEIVRPILNRSILNYCAIGYLGPKGYGMMLEKLLKSPNPPEYVVLVLHPVQFQRHPSWESWLPFVEDRLNDIEPVRSFSILEGLKFARVNYVNSILYNPLPSSYGHFFGGQNQFREFIDRNQGSAVDPSGLKRIPSAEDFLELKQRGPFKPSDAQASWELNAAFEESLGFFSSASHRFAPNKLFIVISPVPETAHAEVERSHRLTAARRISELLQVPADNILLTPPNYPNFYFSSGTHLNPWGKNQFSLEFGEELKRKLSSFPNN